MTSAAVLLIASHHCLSAMLPQVDSDVILTVSGPDAKQLIKETEMFAHLDTLDRTTALLDDYRFWANHK